MYRHGIERHARASAFLAAVGWITFAAVAAQAQANQPSPTSQAEEQTAISAPQDDGSPAPAAAGQQAQAEAYTDDAGEIVVTARYRSEALSKVGQSITAFSAEEIEKSGIQDLADLARLTPSLSVTYNGPGRNTPIIRGLSSANTGQNDALQTPQVVGTYFDDIPINSAMTSQRDVPFYDIARVEVLRGPQGTLYGEASIGGTIRYITADPDMDEFEAFLNGSVGYTRKADRADYVLDGTVSIPLINDRLGARVTGWRRYDAGYIDSILDGTPNYNFQSNYGGRAVILAYPTDSLTVRVITQAEDNASGGIPSVTGDADDQINAVRFFPTTLDDSNHLIGGKISYQTGIGVISSITGYYERRLTRNGAAPIIASIFGGKPITTVDNKDTSVSQEFRFVSEFDGSINAVGGIFYKRLKSESHGFNKSDEDVIYTLYDSDQNQTETQYAIFGEVYFQATQRLRLIGGLRYFEDKIHVLNFNRPGSVLFPNGSETQVDKNLNVLIPKAAVEFQATESTLFYGSISQGARNGGINNVAVIASLPEDQREAAATYDPDKVTAFELGLKTYLFDRDVYMELSGFYNKWSNYQLGVEAPFLSYIESTGAAHTSGLEGSVRWQMARWVSLFAGGSVIEAELDEGTELAPAGAKLTNVPAYNLNVAVDTIVPLGSLDLVGRASFQRIGEAYLGLTNQTPTSDSYRPAYDVLNFSLGVQGTGWSLTSYVTNVTNNLALVQNSLGTGAGPLRERMVLEPRSFRLALRTEF